MTDAHSTRPACPRLSAPPRVPRGPRPRIWRSALTGGWGPPPACLLAVMGLALAGAAEAHYHPHARHFRPFHICYIITEVDDVDEVSGDRAAQGEGPAGRTRSDERGGEARRQGRSDDPDAHLARAEPHENGRCEECSGSTQRDLSILLEDRIRARLGAAIPPRPVLEEKLRTLFRVKLNDRRAQGGGGSSGGGSASGQPYAEPGPP